MQFQKIRLTGFKSFVDASELVIEPGITGLVGPNGCGKSNVVEALRWAMGETSAKRMRGAGMDDVIFSGTATRPARNLAEVAILLNNAERTAPSAFNDAEEVEIVRRIERGAGSHYRINGKEVRARDVQLLFADLASGATSTAIVSQGRIGAIIGAKPTERRLLLEEAAGIRGLHSRRHEAELRLRAAEANLERLEDVIGALQAQEQGLQRQVRQAARYRRLSETVRRFDAIALHLRWVEARARVEAARAALAEAEARVEDGARAAAGAAREQADAASALPGLREAEAKAAAELQRLSLEQRHLESEEERVETALDAALDRLKQIGDDEAREGALGGDAKAALDRLKAETAALSAARDAEGPALAEAEGALRTAEAKTAERQDLLDRATEEVAGVEAQRAQLQRQRQEAERRIEILAARAEEIAAERAGLAEDIAATGALDEADRRLAEAEAALTAARSATAGAEEARAAARQAETARRSEHDRIQARARETLTAAEAEALKTRRAAEGQARVRLAAAEATLAKLASEEAGLARVLESAADGGGGHPPVLDALEVDPGLETALGAALGDDLDASLDEDAPARWGASPGGGGDPALPEGATALARFVRAPGALARRLAQIGVVADAAQGAALAAGLLPGQRLVDRNGALWRWDGYTRRAEAGNPAAARLEQRNRLAGLRDALEHADRALETARAETQAALAQAAEAAEAALAEARARAEAETRTSVRALEDAEADAARAEDSFRAARDAEETAFKTAETARAAVAALQAGAAEARRRLAALEDAESRRQADLAQAEADLAGLTQALSVLEDPVEARERLNRLRAEVAELRGRLVEKRAELDRLARDAETRAARLAAIESEAASWRERAAGAGARLAELAQRRAEVEAEHARLAERPGALRAAQIRLLDLVGAAERGRAEAADALARAEDRQRRTDAGAKAAEAALAQAREMRARREAELDGARQAQDQIAERIAEKLDCGPEEALKAGRIDPDEVLPDLAEAQARLEKANRERDAMGPVNLRAEQESEELAEQIASMHQERDDLTSAIARLRQGIGALNREGRERLLVAYEKVNASFQELFTRLFGGGSASLELTESDDPLQAGLEIMASPPGKKTQIMSLLSGGEQALTALSLLFAVFLTNPAPICVLDEVDAPLDDANVDRFCTMLEEMAKAQATRFLVVTHHRMTMARMDRLFGVTMAERGVSQLVSVDLRMAEALRDA